MKNPFNAESAYEICKTLEKPDAETLGVLVGEDSNGELVVLKAYSGRDGGKLSTDGWCKPLFDPIEFEGIEKHYEELMAKDRQNSKNYSAECLKKLRDLYKIPTLFSGVKTLEECFCGPLPAGSGDCAGAKLLGNAISLGLKVKSLAEADTKTGALLEPCDSRCRLIFAAMLGLDIVYKDDFICVVNKESGLLSIKGKNSFDCIPYRLQKIYNLEKSNLNVHRLDQDTSGLMVFCLTDKAQSVLQKAFEEHQVVKEYIAWVDGLVLQEEGRIEQKTRLDIDNRPHQILDEEHGKLGITNYKRLKVQKINGKLATQLSFSLLTGRTHQIRTACAFALNAPILGDRLYGNPNTAPRLMLHQRHLAFVHPITGEQMDFVQEPVFPLFLLKM